LRLKIMNYSICFKRFLIIVFGLFVNVNFIGAIMLDEVTPKNIVQLTENAVQDFINTCGKSAAQKLAKSITKENIGKISSDTIRWLVKADKGLAKDIAQQITKENIKKIDWTIKWLVEVDKGLAKDIVQLITKENIEKISLDAISRWLVEADKGLAKDIAQQITKENIEKISSNTISWLVKADKELAKDIAQLITKENIEKISSDTIRWLVEVDKGLAKDIVQLITKENIEKISSDTIRWLVEADKGLAKYIAQQITKENIEKISEKISGAIAWLVEADKEVAKEIALLITIENIEKIHWLTIGWLVKADKEVAKEIALLITKENIGKIDERVIESLFEVNVLPKPIEQKVEEYKNILKEYHQCDLFFFVPEITYILRWASTLNTDIRGLQNDMQSKKHFESLKEHYNKIGALEKVLSKVENIQDRSMILRLLHVCEQEEGKGNITFIHGQQRYFFPLSETFKRIVELKKYQGRNIAGYYPLRFVQQGKEYALSDAKIADLVKNGLVNYSDGQYTLCMNAFLLGNAEKSGSYSLGYWLNNSDQSDKKSLNLTLRAIFDAYEFGEYYNRYQQEFDALEEEFLQNKKRGSLLVLSMTPEQVTKWVYPSSVGRKKDNLIVDGKETDDIVAFMRAFKVDPKRVRNEDLRFKEWVLILSDQSMDPINGVKIYPFTADDVFVRKWCKKLDGVFEKIKQDMDANQAQQPQIMMNKTMGLSNCQGQMFSQQAQVRLAVLTKQMQ
jgi:hypothetical protein